MVRVPLWQKLISWSLTLALAAGVAYAYPRLREMSRKIHDRTQ